MMHVGVNTELQSQHWSHRARDTQHHVTHWWRHFTNVLILSHQACFSSRLIAKSIFFWSLREVKMASRKCFNILQPSREIYEGYQIFIWRQQPSVKALRDFLLQKTTWKSSETRCGGNKNKGEDAFHMRGSTNIWPSSENTWIVFIWSKHQKMQGLPVVKWETLHISWRETKSKYTAEVIRCDSGEETDLLSWHFSSDVH